MLDRKLDKLLERWDERSFICCRFCFYHFWLPLLASVTALCQCQEAACISWVGVSHHCARRCRKSLCGFVSQAAINAQYFHTSETLATCPPRHQGKGSRTYSCWAVHLIEKAVSQQTRVEADTFALWIWPFFWERFSDMTVYNWHCIDKIKDLVRLPKHANVLVLTNS